MNLENSSNARLLSGIFSLYGLYHYFSGAFGLINIVRRAVFLEVGRTTDNIDFDFSIHFDVFFSRKLRS